MTISQYRDGKMQNTPKVDEVRPRWDDKVCKLIHKKCHVRKVITITYNTI